MKITCTLSEYTKMARQCADIKESANCYKCPFYKLRNDKKEKCDIERFVGAIVLDNENTWENAKRKALEEATMLNNQHAPDDVPPGCIHVTVPRARGERLESRRNH